MSAGPLRRMVGLAGLLALVPIGWLLVQGRIDLVQAAERAVVVLVVVVVLGRVTSAYLRSVARRLDAGGRAVDPAVAEVLAEIRRRSAGDGRDGGTGAGA